MEYRRMGGYNRGVCEWVLQEIEEGLNSPALMVH